MSKKRGFIQTLVVGLLPVIFLTACGAASPAGNDGGSSSSSGGDEPVTLKFAHAGSETHQYHIAATKFKELVEEKTSGSIRVEIYPNAQLGNERDAAEGVRLGTIDMTTVSADGIMANWVPELGIFSVPFLFEDREHVLAVLRGDIGREFDRKMEQQGFKNLGYWEIGFRNLTNNVRPIEKPEDVRGLKIRVQEANIWMEFMKALGATPTPVPFGELYTALQQGIVDGQENPIATIRSMKFYEVQKYLALTRHAYSPSVVVINPGVWTKLSPEQQQAMLDAVNEAGDYQRQYLAEKETEWLEELKAQGMVVTEPDREAFAEATRSVAQVISDQVPSDLIERIRNLR